MFIRALIHLIGLDPNQFKQNTTTGVITIDENVFAADRQRLAALEAAVAGGVGGPGLNQQQLDDIAEALANSNANTNANADQETALNSLNSSLQALQTEVDNINTSGGSVTQSMLDAVQNQVTALQDATFRVQVLPDPVASCKSRVVLTKFNDNSVVYRAEQYQSPTGGTASFCPKAALAAAGTPGEDATIRVVTDNDSQYRVAWPTTEGTGSPGSLIDSGSEDAYEFPPENKGPIIIYVGNCTNISSIMFGGAISDDDVTIKPFGLETYS